MVGWEIPRTIINKKNPDNISIFVYLDSSPKSAICKNIHLLSKETINDTVNLLRTPERPNRFNKQLNNIGNDESPILSQEQTVGITWKWANEGTPIRTTNKASKLRAAKRTNDEMDTSTIPFNLMIQPETHSPKGLYKFQEEMRKIRFDTETEMPCDNISDLNISSTPTNANKDTGYPKNDNNQFKSIDTIMNNDNVNNYNYNNNMRGSATVMNEVMETYATPTTPTNNATNEPTKSDDHQMLNDSLANDLLNDSDFDQMLLTCTERVEKSTVECSQSSGKDVNSRPDQIQIESGSSSEWSLFIDDGADDLLSNIDIDIPISDSLNNSKFTRHKSMPQQQPKSSSNVPVSAVQSNQITGRFKPAPSRKSFTRHESFPITNSFQNRIQKPYEIGSTQIQNSNPGERSSMYPCTDYYILKCDLKVNTNKIILSVSLSIHFRLNSITKGISTMYKCRNSRKASTGH